MTGNSAKVGEKSWKRSEVEEMLGNLCSQREIWLWQLDKMLVTKLWCELCMNCDVHGHILRSSYNLPVLWFVFHTWCSQRIWWGFGLQVKKRWETLFKVEIQAKRAFVRHIACNFVQKSGFFSAWRMVTLTLALGDLETWEWWPGTFSRPLIAENGVKMLHIWRIWSSAAKLAACYSDLFWVSDISHGRTVWRYHRVFMNICVD